jgi:hypothetical protein
MWYRPAIRLGEGDAVRKAAYGAGVLLIVLAGCDSQQTGVGPTSSAPIQSRSTGTITVGDQFEATFIGNPLTYELTAPSTGTLTVGLTWNPDANNARLKLTLDDRSFRASPPNWSPVIGAIPVSAGQTYRVTIDEGQAPWDYGFNDPFMLTTSIEPGPGPFDY